MLSILEPKKSSDTIIILVHGLFGSEFSWVGIDSILYLLRDEQSINHRCDFGLYGYKSKLKGNLFASLFSYFRNLILKNNKTITYSKNLSIEEISSLLNGEVNSKCKSYDNIIFIGHSMGGLVVKDLILTEIRNDIRSKIKYFYSLSTPHNGSTYALLAKLFNHKQINDLKPYEKYISKLNDEWIKYSDKLPHCHFFISMSDQLVEPHNQKPPGTEYRNSTNLEEDHFSVKKDSTGVIKNKIVGDILKLKQKSIFYSEKELIEELIDKLIEKKIIDNIHKQQVIESIIEGLSYVKSNDGLNFDISQRDEYLEKIWKIGVNYIEIISLKVLNNFLQINDIRVYFNTENSLINKHDYMLLIFPQIVIQMLFHKINLNLLLKENIKIKNKIILYE
jgi:Putative serine esterase (DUF676)